jgi:hypothetical protein
MLRRKPTCNRQREEADLDGAESPPPRVVGYMSQSR